MAVSKRAAAEGCLRLWLFPIVTTVDRNASVAALFFLRATRMVKAIVSSEPGVSPVTYFDFSKDENAVLCEPGTWQQTRLALTIQR